MTDRNPLKCSTHKPLAFAARTALSDGRCLADQIENGRRQLNEGAEDGRDEYDDRNLAVGDAARLSLPGISFGLAVVSCKVGHGTPLSVAATT